MGEGEILPFFILKDGEMMPVTGQQVFDLAISLIDEVSESGSLNIENPGYYKTKTLTFLTILQTELLPQHLTPTILTDLSQELQLSDRISISILPYGLAAHLLLSDGDTGVASFFNDRYEELKKKMPTEIELVSDVYGVNQGMNY